MHPPGWYPDPQVPGQRRWWDGHQWTAHVGPAADPTGTGAGPWAVASVAPVAPRSSRTGLVVTGVVCAVAVLAVAAILAVTLLGRSSPSVRAPVTTPTTQPSRTGGTGGGSENQNGSGPTELQKRADAAGISVLGAEGSVTHDHALVVVTVDGEPAQVPASIGIDPTTRQIAVVHTHDTTGIVHIESPHAEDTYTLGQFLTLAGFADDAALCDAYARRPCRVDIQVTAPTAADRNAFKGHGPMPDTPPVQADGRDTVLAQGAVIQIRLTTAT